MKLIIAILNDSDDAEVIRQLVEHQYRVTRVASTGGFLRRGNVTLLIGAEADQVPGLVAMIDSACQPPPPGLHKATIFVVNATNFEQI